MAVHTPTVLTLYMFLMLHMVVIGHIILDSHVILANHLLVFIVLINDVYDQNFIR